MKIKSILIASGILLILICLLGYISAPSTATFEWASLNPLAFLSGLAFLFSFGFGFPVFVSILMVILLLIASVFLLGKAVNRFFKDK